MGRIVTEAWVLPSGSGALEQRTVDLGELGRDEALVEPLLGCWEGNMTHAVRRQPVDIARARGEPFVILGNSGVVRVLAVGEDVKTLGEGDECVVFANGGIDPHGYMETVYAYDAKNTFGIL